MTNEQLANNNLITLYLTFAWRYFKAKKSTNAINIISWVTAGVIAFSTMCQVLVLSVFNGFEDLVKSLYSNFYSDVKVVPAKVKTFTLTQQQLHKIHSMPGIKGSSLNIEEKALLQNQELQTVVLLKGVDTNYYRVSGVPQKMYDGIFNTGTVDNPKLILGAGIENALGVQADRNLLPITVFLPKKTSSNNPLESLSEGNATTSGSFAIQQDFDNKYVITNIDFVKYMLDLGTDQYSSLEIVLVNPSKTENIKKVLENENMKDCIKMLIDLFLKTSLIILYFLSCKSYCYIPIFF